MYFQKIIWYEEEDWVTDYTRLFIIHEKIAASKFVGATPTTLITVQKLTNQFFELLRSIPFVNADYYAFKDNGIKLVLHDLYNACAIYGLRGDFITERQMVITDKELD